MPLRLRSLSGLGVAAVAVFHAWLLLRRLAEPASLEPVVALRWLGAAILLVALLAAQRLRLPLTGRRAMAAWACVLLLHVPGAVPLEAPATTAAPMLALEAPAVAAALLSLAGLSLASLAGAAAQGSPHGYGRLPRPAPAWRPGLSDDARTPFAPRPPPR